MAQRTISFRSKLQGGFALSTLLVILITVVAHSNLSRLEDEHKWINHTQQVIEYSNEVLQAVTDAETAARGYFGTKNETFIKPYHDAVASIEARFNLLDQSVSTDASQSDQAKKLRHYISKKVEIMGSYINQRKTSIDAHISADRVMEGKIAMDRIRQTIAAIIETEKDGLYQRQQASENAANRTSLTLTIGAIVFLIIIVVLFMYIRITFSQKEKAEAEVKNSNLELQQALRSNEANNWQLTGLRRLSDRMQGQLSEQQLGDEILRELISYTNGVTGSLYVYDKTTGFLNYCAGFAFEDEKQIKKQIKLTETLIGQVAKSKTAQLISGPLNSKLSFASSITQKQLVHSFMVPFLYEQELEGIMELAYWNSPDTYQREFIIAAAENIGIAIHTAQARTEMQALYNEIQQQAEELAVQQEELRAANDELLTRMNNRQ